LRYTAVALQRVAEGPWLKKNSAMPNFVNDPESAALCAASFAASEDQYR
jgi:hypothetical protein